MLLRVDLLAYQYRVVAVPIPNVVGTEEELPLVEQPLRGEVPSKDAEAWRERTTELPTTTSEGEK